VRRVFISHPFGANPRINSRNVRALARRLAHRGHLPLAPQFYLPQFLDEASERDLALNLCVALVALSDEVWVYGTPTAGMRLEIAEARRLGIPVVDGVTGEPMPAKREPPRRADARAAVKR